MTATRIGETKLSWHEVAFRYLTRGPQNESLCCRWRNRVMERNAVSWEFESRLLVRIATRPSDADRQDQPRILSSSWSGLPLVWPVVRSPGSYFFVLQGEYAYFPASEITPCTPLARAYTQKGMPVSNVGGQRTQPGASRQIALSAIKAFHKPCKRWPHPWQLLSTGDPRPPDVALGCTPS